MHLTSPSIAVLPFDDMSPGKDQDYFCEGMAEEIINALTGLEGLHVASRPSTRTPGFRLSESGMGTPTQTAVSVS